jgi:hypothetical protein
MTPAMMKIQRGTFYEIKATVGSLKAETGGPLGGRLDDRIVSDFFFDQHARRSAASYSPNTTSLNKLLNSNWNPRRIRLLGFVHSHPVGSPQPSLGDERYIAQIMQANPAADALYMPIIRSAADFGARFRIFPFLVVRGRDGVLRVEPCLLRLVGDLASAPPSANPRASVTAESPVELRYVGPSSSETYVRVTEAYDLARLSTSRLIIVGCGGSTGFVESMARAGIPDFILIDPDRVSRSNLATQQYYRRDVGKPKVECLRDRILGINELATVQAIPVALEDISDDEFERLTTAPLRQWDVPLRGMWGLAGIETPARVLVLPSTILLGGFTDSFPAQARINRLALEFGFPSLCAQMYEHGRAAEITFTAPGITAACHRCALRSRFEAYQNGYKSSVTSNGTPVFATDRLNASKGFLAMALLHHGSKHPFWGSLLTRIGDRNLIQIRMDPEVALPVFSRVFAGAETDRVLFDESVWLRQKPDGPANGLPPCPDCGGTGDLRKAIGTFTDTRIMRS